jgi:hypothetical protein
LSPARSNAQPRATPPYAGSMPRAPASKNGGLNVTMLERPLTHLVLALYEEQIPLGPPLFPPIASLTWGGAEAPPQSAQLRLHDNELDLVLTDLARDNDNPFSSPKRRPRQPAVVTFGNGTSLSARLAAWSGRKSTFGKHGHREENFVSLACWTWQPRSSTRYWVAEVEGRPPKTGNLVVETGKTNALCGLRMESKYDLHLLTTGTGRLRLVVDTHGAPFDQRLLGHEVQALEFGLGNSFRIGTFLALNAKHRVVGAANAAFDLHFDTKANRGPVPGASGHQHGYWAPVFASAVSRKLREDRGEDAPCRISSTAYRDSLSGHVHKRYLIAQVALEALAKKLVPKAKGKKGHLVKNVPAWHAWISSVESAIREQATDKDSARTLLNRLNHNVFDTPTTARVAAALDHYGLKVPEDALKEIGLRNDVAHAFVMFRKELPDANELVRRIAIIQTLLVALTAKYVGYTGPIAGWELDASRWPATPDWWPNQDAPGAHRSFVAAVSKSRRKADPPKRSRPRVSANRPRRPDPTRGLR